MSETFYYYYCLGFLSNVYGPTVRIYDCFRMLIMRCVMCCANYEFEALESVAFVGGLCLMTSTVLLRCCRDAETLFLFSELVAYGLPTSSGY